MSDKNGLLGSTRREEKEGGGGKISWSRLFSFFLSFLNVRAINIQCQPSPYLFLLFSPPLSVHYSRAYVRRPVQRKRRGEGTQDLFGHLHPQPPGGPRKGRRDEIGSSRKSRLLWWTGSASQVRFLCTFLAVPTLLIIPYAPTGQSVILLYGTNVQ